MTKEQAIEIIEKMIKSYIEADACGLSNNDFKYEIRAMQTVLSMLKEKDKEIENLKMEKDEAWEEWNNLEQSSYEEEKRKEMRITEKQVQQLDREITLELEIYRNKSVKRVLDYINHKCWEHEDIEIDKLQTLIVHCLNKLNGNIDGIELSLED